MSTDESIEDAAQEVDDPEGNKTYSCAYLSALFLGIVGLGIASVFFGYVEPNIVVNATLNAGWIVEYFVAGLGTLFLLWTFAQIANITGMNFISGLIGVIARVADNYSLPEDSE